MSFDILVSSIAVSLRAAEKWTKSAMLWVDSMRLSADVRLSLVSFLSSVTTICLYFGCVFMPVPTAVPPMLNRLRRLDALFIDCC